MKKQHLSIFIFAFISLCILHSCKKEEATLLNVNPNILEFEEDGGTQNIRVETNSNEWSISNNTKWFTVEKSGSNAIVVNAKVNNDISERNGSFIVTSNDKSVKVSIKQAPKTILKIADKAVEFEIEGGTKEIDIETNVKSWSIKETPAWINAQRKENKLIIKVGKNTGEEIRKAIIEVAANDQTAFLEVTQDVETIIEINPQSLEFPYRESTKEITVKVNKKIDAQYFIGLDWANMTKAENGIIKITAQLNRKNEVRKGKYAIRIGDKIKEVFITQAANTIEEEQRLILETLYKSTNGKEWKNNENWLSNKPIGEWHGVETTEGYGVVVLLLTNNNLNGSLPKDIAKLENLSYFSAAKNNLSGIIPPEIGKLKALNILFLSENNITGNIPKELGDLDLKSISLYNNRLTGSIPEKLLRFSKQICKQQEGYGFDNSECNN